MSKKIVCSLISKSELLEKEDGTNPTPEEVFAFYKDSSECYDMMFKAVSKIKEKNININADERRVIDSFCKISNGFLGSVL